MVYVSIVFWTSIVVLAYTYLGYPALIWALGRATSRPRPPRPHDDDPKVTVLVVAHNEAGRISDRLENLLALDYPHDRLEIVLASDGSTDDTVERARAYEQAGVRVIAFEQRRAKPPVLNELVPKAQGDIVVLADVRQRFEAGAVRALVGPFVDPEVGAVSGELMLTDNAGRTAVGAGIGFYWRYEKFIRWNERRAGSTVGSTGAIYAIRRRLFEPIPESTPIDDVIIPMRIARKGYRVLFEPAARAYDRAAATAREEFRRKVRTIAGNFHLFACESWLLNPFQNPLWFQTVSHKLLRLVSPLCLLVAFCANLWLRDSPLYASMLAAQIAFYVAALGGYAMRNATTRIPILTIPYTMCLLHWATVVGFFRFINGRHSPVHEHRGRLDKPVANTRSEPARRSAQARRSV